MEFNFSLLSKYKYYVRCVWYKKDKLSKKRKLENNYYTLCLFLPKQLRCHLNLISFVFYSYCGLMKCKIFTKTFSISFLR